MKAVVGQARGFDNRPQIIDHRDSTDDDAPYVKFEPLMVQPRQPGTPPPKIEEPEIVVPDVVMSDDEIVDVESREIGVGTVAPNGYDENDDPIIRQLPNWWTYLPPIFQAWQIYQLNDKRGDTAVIFWFLNIISLPGIWMIAMLYQDWYNEQQVWLATQGRYIRPLRDVLLPLAMVFAIITFPFWWGPILIRTIFVLSVFVHEKITT